MDDRIREHAAVLVDWSARIESGDDVIVSVGEGAHELGVAVAEQLGDRGANMLARYGSPELSRAYLRAHDGDFDPDPTFELGLYEQADSVLSLRGYRNTSARTDVPGDTRREYAQARAGIRDAHTNTDWVSTVHPTRAAAQQAGMSFAAYQEFVYDAILRDWATLADEMDRLKQRLDAGSRVRIVADETGTDLSFSIADRRAVNSAASVAYDSHNLPSGEVFTAPREATGEVVFDVPMTIRGTRVRNARIELVDGVVVDWAAELGEHVLTDIIETDEGARQLGEFGVGMNRGIDRVTDQILFDEKMAGTVHLALGRAYDACLPGEQTGNDSAVHVDLIADMTHADSRLEIDGESVQQGGEFHWAEEAG